MQNPEDLSLEELMKLVEQKKIEEKNKLFAEETIHIGNLKKDIYIFNEALEYFEYNLLSLSQLKDVFESLCTRMIPKGTLCFFNQPSQEWYANGFENPICSSSIEKFWIENIRQIKRSDFKSDDAELKEVKISVKIKK